MTSQAQSLSPSTIDAKLRDVFGRVFDGAVAYAPELTREQVRQWDSINHFSLMLEIEHAFGIQLDGAAVAQVKSVADLKRLLDSKLAH